jgi:precorrin-6B methylase 2
MLERDKYEYYSGKMCEEDLEERNWKPLTLKILKGDVPKYVEGDPDIIQNLVMIGDQREKVGLLNSIITTVNNRSFVITNAIKWKQFTNGVNG